MRLRTLSKPPWCPTDGDHEDALDSHMEGAMSEEVVRAPEHAITPCQHVVEQKEVFDDILKCLRRIDASLSKASLAEKTEKTSDDTKVSEAKRLGEKSATGVEAKQSERFFDLVRVWDTEEMISMIEKEPRLMLETSTWGKAVCTVFQLAVLLNSDEMVAKMLRIAIHKYGPSPRELFGVVKMDGFDMSALDIALVRGNKCIAELLEDADRGRDIKFDKIRYTPGLEEEEKQDVLALLRPILNADFEAVFKGDSRAQKWLKEGYLPSRTIRTMLIQRSGKYWLRTGGDSLWWGRRYGISLKGEEDNLFVLHQIAKNFCRGDMVFSEFSFWEEVLEKICQKLGRKHTARLLKLTDHHGETPVHVHASPVHVHPWFAVTDFMSSVEKYCDLTFGDLCNIRDLADRTCLHIATIHDRSDVVDEMATKCGDRFKILDAPYGDRHTTALHLAVRHNYTLCVQVLVKHRCDINKRSGCYIKFNNQQGSEWGEYVGAFQMAILEGRLRIMQTLLKDDRLEDWSMINRRDRGIPALHCAVHSGNPLAVKILLDSGKFNLFAVDLYGNTALHSVASWEGTLHLPYLQHSDFAKPRHYFDFKSRNPAAFNPDLQQKSLGRIIACMDLLMQAGLDMEQPNTRGETPQLMPTASDDLTKWWYDKLVRQDQEAKTNLVAAANAVSVTAALVATASFVGPLQPPLGLSPSTDASLTGYSQVNHTAVQVFLFCDSLSFYLAIASIMLAVIPSLTIPQEGLPLEVRIANRVVQVAVILLFVSITFVICAFSAASIAIVPETRWHYKALAIVSTIVGAFICSMALCLFLLRLMRLIRPKDKWVRNLTNYAFSRSKKLKKIESAE